MLSFHTSAVLCCMTYSMLLSSLDQFYVISSRFWLAGHSKHFVYDVVHILENVGIPGRISTEFSFVWESVCECECLYVWGCMSVRMNVCVNLWGCMWEWADTYVCGVVCMYVLIGSWYIAQTVNLGYLASRVFELDIYHHLWKQGASGF